MIFQILNYPEDTTNSDNNAIANLSTTTRDFRSITQNGYNQESNIQPANNYESSNAEIIEIGEATITDVEDIESNFLTKSDSQFDLAEEELSMEQGMDLGEEISMVSEAMRRMNYERKFSVSLYAVNGITECLKLKVKSGGVTRSEQLTMLQNTCKRNLEKERENEECNVGMTEKKDEENVGSIFVHGECS